MRPAWLSFEKGLPLPDYYDIRKRESRRRVLRIGTALLVICAAAVFGVRYAYGEYGSRTAHLSPMAQLVSKFKVPLYNTQFTRDLRYANTTQPTAGDVYWDSLFPEGAGFVTGWSGNFQDSVDRPDTYCISMFHQLHCLQSLSKALFERDHEDHHMESHGLDHLAHCVDYIRQGIMCAGDMSLEPTSTTRGPDGEITTVVSGYLGTHTCRKWDAMYDFAEKWTVMRAL